MDEPTPQPLEPDLRYDLIRTRTGALVLYAQQWCRSPEDVVQEAWVSLMQQSPAPDCPIAWMYAVVRRRAINAGRSERRRRVHEEGAAQSRHAWFTANAGTAIDPAALEAALRSLADDLREVIVARIWGKLTFEAIGELVGCSVPTAFRRYQAGLEALRAHRDFRDETATAIAPRQDRTKEDRP